MKKINANTLKKSYIKIFLGLTITLILVTIISVIKNPIASAKSRFSDIYSINFEISNTEIQREYTFIKKDDILKLLNIADKIEENTKNDDTDENTPKANIKYTIFMNDNSTIQFTFKNVENYHEYLEIFPNIYNDLTN